MDEVIFEEFKGTGNMELRLDRKLAERRIYPALDVNASSTRHEELLFDRTQLQQVWKLRRVLNALGSEGSDAAGLQLLMDKIKTTRSNDEFLAEIAKTPPRPSSRRPRCITFDLTNGAEQMKTDIHPKYDTAIVQCSCGNTFETRSTKDTLHTELCNACHPFYTGKQKLVDTGGRVERFERRYGRRAKTAKS